jgi:ribose transport system substrate-binding protein
MNRASSARLGLAALLCTGVAGVAAGCGSSSSSTTSAAAATTSSTTNSGGTTSSLVSSAQADVQKYSVNPTIGINIPLTKAPPKGKVFEFLQCSVPVCAQIGDGMQQATQALGWKFERKTFDLAQPASLVNLINNAAQNPPDYLAVTTFPSSVWKEGLAQLKAKHVPVIVGSDAVDVPEGPANGIYGNIASNPSEANAGTRKANWFIADSNGKGKLVHFAASDITTVTAETDALKAKIKQCPGCSIDVVNVPTSAIAAGQVPGMVSSYLQAHPDVNYMSFSFGDMTAGLTPVLQRTGEAKKVKFVGVTPTLENLQSLKSGVTQGAWLGWPATLQGWEFVDVAARVASGTDWRPASQLVLPVQWLTASTIGSPVKLYEPTGYQAAYEKLWHVGQ